MQLKKTITFLGSMLFLSLNMLNLSAVAASEDGYICSHYYHTFGDYKLSGGVGNYGNYTRTYLVDGFGSSNSLYGVAFEKAIYEWRYADGNSPVAFKVGNPYQGEPTVRVEADYLDSRTCGYTCFFTASGTELKLTSGFDGHLTSDYYRTVIYMDTDTIDSCTGEINKYGSKFNFISFIYEHELGHAFGLSHRLYSPNTSIMYNYADGFPTDGVQLTDVNTLKHIYP